MNQQQQTRTCTCGHPELSHEHYRAGTDCGACDCTQFQAPRGNPLMPEHATPPRTVGWSPKALWAAATAAVLPFLLQGAAALLELLTANPALLDGLPEPVKWGISVIVTGLGVLYAARKAGPGNVV